MVVQSPHSTESSVSTARKYRSKRVKSQQEDVVSGQRRVSARLQAIRQRTEKQLLVKRRVEHVLDEDKHENGAIRRKKVKVDSEKLKDTKCGIQQLPKISPVPTQPKLNDKVAKMVKRAAKISEGLDATDALNVVEKSAHIRVKETIRLFNKHYLHILQMKKNNEVLYPEKRIGSLPGIDVGHRFYSRAEMCALGFHSHWLNGIDYMGKSYRKGEYKHYIFPLAVAIVLSGVYEDDLDNAEDVVYTGQGGHDLTGNKRQIRDQVSERGNLALKNCVDFGVPVRVVRGHESASSYSGKVYTYDGLYKVVEHWKEKGISGFIVFKYRLRRVEGQPTLTTSQVQFTYGCVPKSPSEIRGLVCEDISGGQEDIPIPATNLVDDPPVAPTGKLNLQICCLGDGYTYCKSMKVALNIKLPANANGCGCKGVCWDPKICACARINGSDFPYVHCDGGGRLIEAKHVVFECGPKCGCDSSCVFRTPKKGWAVRSWDFIPAGSPVCEYIGVLMRTEEMDSVSESNYIFEIDCLQTMRGLSGREKRQQDASLPMIQNMDKIDEERSESDPEFFIDAGSYGNVARFFNHSCEPNLFIQCVLRGHQDIKLARVMLFAADNIPPWQELTYDYGYALDSVHGSDGKVKRMPCYCGAEDCRKRLF
ncbi:hypothetical protein PTKIN_Ptkin07bG0002400 [Pterospermum kingtungense]